MTNKTDGGEMKGKRRRGNGEKKEEVCVCVCVSGVWSDVTVVPQ